MSATCFFIGHRNTPESVFLPLLAAVERHITEYGVTDFVVGHYGRFDSLTAQAVMEAKKRHPPVTLTLLLPYHPSEQSIPMPHGFDGTFYPPGMETVPKKFAILRANQYMLDHSDYLITYVRHIASNTQTLVRYAKARKGRIKIENLA